jgi:hypothetical protein
MSKDIFTELREVYERACKKDMKKARDIVGSDWKPILEAFGEGTRSIADVEYKFDEDHRDCVCIRHIDKEGAKKCFPLLGPNEIVLSEDEVRELAEIFDSME